MTSKVLESAVELLEGKTGNYTAHYGENIKALLTWKNHVIDAGVMVQVGFVLGDGEHMYVFEMEGVQWIIGALVQVSAPGLLEARTTDVPSKAAWILNGAFDGLAFVGQAVGPISTVMWEARMIGLHANEFLANMQFLGFKWFYNVLTVEAPPAPVEIQNLEFVGL